MVKVAGSDLGAISGDYIGRCGRINGDPGGDTKAVGATARSTRSCWISVGEERLLTIYGGDGGGVGRGGDGLSPNEGRFEHEGELDEADCDIQDCGDDDEDEEADHGEANGGAYLPCNSVVFVALVPEDGEGAHDNCPASDNVEQRKPQRAHVGEHLVGNAILDCDVKRHEKNGDTREEEAEEYNNLGEPRDHLVFGVLHVDHEHNDAEEKEQSDDDAHCDYDSVDGHGEVQGGEGEMGASRAGRRLGVEACK